MENEIRKVENYTVSGTFKIGKREIVLGEDMQKKDGYYYLLADCEHKGIFAKYSNITVCDDYFEIIEEFIDRCKSEVQNFKLKTQDYPTNIITQDKCDDINGKDLTNKIIVINSEDLRPEYRTEAYQIVRCLNCRTNDNKTSISYRGFFDTEKRLCEQANVLGILKSEHYPDWLKDKLQHNQLNQRGNKHKEFER